MAHAVHRSVTLCSFFGGVFAFICAAIAVGSDAQSEVNTRLGRIRGTNIVSWPGVAFVVFWGLADVAFYVAFLFNHEWAKKAFDIEIEKNLLWSGMVVGLSAVLIFRTNLATVGSVQVGGEWLYTTTRAYLIDALNRKRSRHRYAFLNTHKPFYNDCKKYPAYFTALHGKILDLAIGSPHKSEIETALDKTKTSGSEQPDTDVAVRMNVTGVAYDYFGAKEFEDWAAQTFGNS